MPLSPRTSSTATAIDTFKLDTDRYPEDKLSELLLAMSEEGFAQVSTKVTAEVAGVLEHR